MKHKLLILIFSLAAIVSSLQAQKLEKGFKSLGEKDYFKAKRIFSKSMYGYPSVGAYGLSLMHYEDKNPFFSLDSALKYVVYADSAMTMADKKEMKMINRFALSKEVLAKHRLKIASKASAMLGSDASLEQYELFLKKYPFALEYKKVIGQRDSLAYTNAKLANTNEAYREFLINYPGSEYKSAVDSLYAKSFFLSKIGEGGIDAYKQFVKDFPNSPYIQEAYDLIFANVRSIDTKEAYKEFIDDYVENAYTMLAWENLIGLLLKDDYSEKSIAKILADYPLNPLSSVVENELKGFFISYFPVEVAGKWGFIRGDGELVVPAVYESTGTFHEGLAMVQRRGKKGFVDKQGKVVITLEYDDVFDVKHGVAIVEKDGLFGVVDRRNKVVIPVEYDDIGELIDDRILVEKDGKIAYFNGVGEKKIDFEYDNGLDFINKRAVVKKDGLYGLIDADNQVIVPFAFDWVERSDQERIRAKQGDAFGLLSLSGDTLLPFEYDWIGVVEKNMPILIQKEEKVGYLGANNEIIIPLEYDLVGEGKEMFFHGDYARVSKGGKYGVIDNKGEVILPIEYKNLGVPNENFVSYEVKGRWGFRELNEGKRIIEPKYDRVTPFERGVAIVLNGDKYGVIDPNGMSILREEYTSVESEETVGMLIAEKNGLKGLMDRDKNLILGFKYKSLKVENYRYVRCVNQDGVSFYDLQKNKFIWPTSGS